MGEFLWQTTKPGAELPTVTAFFTANANATLIAGLHCPTLLSTLSEASANKAFRLSKTSLQLANRLTKRRAARDCALGSQHNANVDDSAVDHSEMYRLDGKTIPEDARLADRDCNCARPKQAVAYH